ncbi:MAG: ABC transporter ATP-binding protein [Solobacterium sp.]|nr:ABC transporter ATP-binding protein [Solobacterium sp.]
MKLIFEYIGKHKNVILIAIFIKLFATLSELLLPYILEHIVDHVVLTNDLKQVLFWGMLMFVTAITTRMLNVTANGKAIDNAHTISYEIRQALFEKTMALTGSQFDSIGLPSLISRMTSDSYNVQSAVQQIQSLCIRAPMMLIGGVIVAMVMDFHLAMVMLIMLPVLIVIILTVSSKGIPMYTKVQQKLDVIVRIMRENITGIRVVKALSKEDYEIRRFADANRDMTKTDISAATVMAIPGPLMQLFLNIGLSVVVLYGSYRVNQGFIKPGVILAFLTYFNMIAMGVMGLNRIFMTMSKATASADRIYAVMQTEEEKPKIIDAQDETETDDMIVFDHVDFSYGKGSNNKEDFAGEEREKALYDITFSMKKGESLGIIGPTGCGKTTIINLLMHFYDPDQGKVLVEGKPVSSYQKQELRRKFGTVFQNDMIFQDTLHENIDFGRNLEDEHIDDAVGAAMAKEFIDSLDEGLDYMAAIKGANLSGGQKQRLYVARALAAKPEILILDDSSSALDYKTDAAMRNAINKYYPETTLIMIAQRVSSVMNMDKILVLDNGKCIGYGDHATLLETCDAYREIYEIQMGAMQG